MMDSSKQLVADRDLMMEKSEETTNSKERDG